jgi:spermidine synthase
MLHGEKILASLQSPFNHIVVTEDRNGLRSLHFGESQSRQSAAKIDDPLHLELPYVRVLPNCLAFVPKLQRMLIVGLGGGSLPRFFRQLFPKLRIDVVELDPVVVEVAREYFRFEADARMRVHLEDARDYIERFENQFDLVVLDGFDSETIPRHLSTLEFLQGVRRALVPGGVAVSNVWGRSSNRLYDHMHLTYREAFEDLYLLDVPEAGTKIFVALQAKRPMTRNAILQWAQEASKNHGLHTEFIHALAGFRHSDEEPIRGGGVLRD